MKRINPMTKILLAMCSFGILMGMMFPVYAGHFIEWIPGKKALFLTGCILAGFFVGVFGYMVLKVILRRIDTYYKKTLLRTLNVMQFNKGSHNKDLLLSMQAEFEELVNRFYEMKKDEERRLKELAITDCLTSLYNHRHFHVYVNEKLDNSSRQIGLLFCDIDRFKSINDTYGHTVGDRILGDVAGVIKREVRGGGCAFRYGGEEFIVVIEGSVLEEVYEKAEQIRLKISQIDTRAIYKEDIPLSVSIGIAMYPDHASDAEELLAKADAAMYVAKNNGRNQCRVYDKGIEISFESVTG